MSTSGLIVLGITSLVAATVNGALGYGYSSISVPVALLVTVSRVLNPALVIVELAVNLYSLALNRRALHRVVARTIPVAVGLVPGVVAGALLLGHGAPTYVKLFSFGALLPLVLLQAWGKRWSFRNERRAAVPFGGAIGFLYGATTISGPPLSLFWRNQGLSKDDFKVAVAAIRSIEAICAVIAYTSLGLITHASATLLPWIVPGVLVGLPLGHAITTRTEMETFRRVCMSFDAYLISFGLTRTLAGSGVPAVFAYQVLLGTIAIDAALLRRSRRLSVCDR